jgi:predicted metalloprotease with PDZ domain
MKISKLSLVFFSSILVSCGSNKEVLNKELATNSPIVTSLDLTKVIDDKVPVMINPGRFTSDKVIFRLPRIVQGTYSVSDFGKYIDDFKAIDYQGNEMPVLKIDTNSWSISDAGNLDKINYYVNDTFDQEINGGIGKETPFSPSGTNIESTNFVLNLHGFIGYFDSLKNAEYALDIISKTDFKRTSALQNTGSEISEDGQTTTTSYFATRYFDITDNPMFYGDLDVVEFLVDDIKIVLSVYSPNKVHTALSLKETMFKMMQGQKAYLGNINSTSRYDIYVYLSEGKKDSPKGFGALEHHTSTVVVLPESMPAEALAKSMTDVVAHEFFHIVTPLSVHSEDVHYFDYNKPTFSKHLWMYEGVTEYFAQHFQAYEGLVTEDEFLKTIMIKIDRASNLNDAMSFTKMSENVLDEKYASEYANVYQKGALIGMCLDILLREESKGSRSILSLMKELSNKYGKNKPFVDDTIIKEISEMTYPSVADFLSTHVVGDTPIKYSMFFEKVGLVFKTDTVETNFILMNGAPIVSADGKKGTIFFSEAVTENSFWTEQGVIPGDVIKNINGTEVSLASANTIFQEVFQWKIGQDIEVALDRNGEDIVIKTKTTQPYTVGKILSVNPKATENQNNLRNSWMKG